MENSGHPRAYGASNPVALPFKDEFYWPKQCYPIRFGLGKVGE